MKVPRAGAGGGKGLTDSKEVRDGSMGIMDHPSDSRGNSQLKGQLKGLERECDLLQVVSVVRRVGARGIGVGGEVREET